MPPVDRLPIPALVLSAAGRVLAANPSAGRLLRALTAGTLETARHEIQAAARDDNGYTGHLAFEDGETLVECDISVVPLGAGRALVLARYGALDRSLREALVDSRRRYKDLVEISSDFAWETGPDGTFVFVSPRGALGWIADQLVGRPAVDFIHREADSDADAAAGDAAWNPFTATRPLHDTEFSFRRADGTIARLRAAVQPLHDSEGRAAGARGICRDVTEESARDAALARAHVRERLFGYIVRAMREEVEPAKMLSAAAAALARALTARGSEIHRVGPDGPVLAAGFGAASPLSVQGCVAAALRRAGVVSVTGDGATLLAVAARYRGGVNGVLSVWRDAALGPFLEDERRLAADAAEHLALALEQVAAHEQLETLSSTDPLTGLLNRRRFMAEVVRRFERAARSPVQGGAGGALVYCDLDNFKQVNDTHGHERGDAAIREMAQILKNATRGEDLVARLGGDEFALWLEGTDAATAAARADVLLERGHALRAYSGGPDHPLGMSLGVAVLQPGGGESLDQLMARADGAMYASKRRGKGQVTLATPQVAATRRASGDTP